MLCDAWFVACAAVDSLARLFMYAHSHSSVFDVVVVVVVVVALHSMWGRPDWFSSHNFLKNFKYESSVLEVFEAKATRWLDCGALQCSTAYIWHAPVLASMYSNTRNTRYTLVNDWQWISESFGWSVYLMFGWLFIAPFSVMACWAHPVAGKPHCCRALSVEGVWILAKYGCWAVIQDHLDPVCQGHVLATCHRSLHYTVNSHSKRHSSILDGLLAWPQQR